MTAMRISGPTLNVLAELLLSPATWRYGYDLTKATGTAAGTLYPLLRRLEEQGWLATAWEERGEAGRPPRHLYRLTAAGVSGAHELLERAALKGWSVRGLVEEGGT